MGKTKRHYLSETLELPADLMQGEVQLRILGDSKLYLENYRYILDYSKEILKIQCKKNRLRIMGENLLIEYFSKDEMLVTGHIEEVSFY